MFPLHSLVSFVYCLVVKILWPINWWEIVHSPSHGLMDRHVNPLADTSRQMDFHCIVIMKYSSLSRETSSILNIKILIYTFMGRKGMIAAPPRLLMWKSQSINVFARFQKFSPLIWQMLRLLHHIRSCPKKESRRPNAINCASSNILSFLFDKTLAARGTCKDILSFQNQTIIWQEGKKKKGR